MALDLLDKSVSDDKLKQATIEDVARAVKSMFTMVEEHKTQISDGARTREESENEFKTRLSDIGKMVETLKAQRVPDGALDDKTGSYAARKGGLFRKDAPLLPYDKLISLSPDNSIVRGEDKELLADLEDANDALVFKYHAERYCAARNNNSDPSDGSVKQFALERAKASTDWKRFEDLLKYTGYAKADEIIHTQTGGVANPLTMSLVSGRVLDLVRINLNVANKFPEVPMQNFDQKIPANRGDGIGVRGGAGVTDPPPRDAITSPFPSAAHFGTISFGQVALVAEDVLAYLWWNDRAVTDTVIPMVPYLRNMIAFMHARAIDRGCMSGDIQGRTQGNHMDDHASAFTIQDARTLWNGLRRIGANYMTDLGGGAFDEDDVKAMRKRLGVYGLNPSDLALWMNTGPLYDLIGEANVTTIDKFGPQATIKTGTLGMIYGIPLYPTEWIPTDLDATTGFSAAAGTQTAAVLANVTRFLLGVMGTTTIETTRVAPMLTTVIQATGRFDFAPIEAIDANEIFAAGATVPIDITHDIDA